MNVKYWVCIFILPFLSSACVSLKNSDSILQRLKKNKKYIVYSFDHEAEDKGKGVIEFENSAIFVTSQKKYKARIFSTGTVVSEIGYKVAPVWNKQGNKIYFRDHSEMDLEKDRKGIINILDLNDGKTNAFKDLDARSGPSLDLTESIFVFADKNNMISLYHINEHKKEALFQAADRPEGLTLSPDGKHIVFTTRDGSHVNDHDGWRINLYDIELNKLLKIGSTKDDFGVLPDFWWHKSSSKFVFTGMLLEENKAISFKYWVYDLISQKSVPHSGMAEGFFSQKVRGWEADRFF